MLTIDNRKVIIKSAIVLLAAFLSCSATAGCFSYKNTWDKRTVKPKTFEWQVFESLKLGPGQIRSFECQDCEDEKTWAASSVSRTASTFRFKTNVGNFVFHAGPNIELKETDIDFNDDKDTGGHNRIYRELVLKGYVSNPGVAAKGFGAKPVPATLIIRGMGNNCHEAGSYQQWLMRVDTDKRQLTGAGKMIDTTEYPKAP